MTVPLMLVGYHVDIDGLLVRKDAGFALAGHAFRYSVGHNKGGIAAAFRDIAAAKPAFTCDLRNIAKARP